MPFLQFFRVKVILCSIVGGAYLYGAELLAPFIARVGRPPGSRISKGSLSWLMGLGSARTDRCRGWVEFREFGDVAIGMALRAIDDAKRHGGLLEQAIFQSQRNFENAGQSARKRCIGRLTTVVRKT